MTARSFQRRIENFVCEHCGEKVIGDGYTNHCPKCLWSKHVDVNPGDRMAHCGGMMKPEALEGASPIIGSFISVNTVALHARMQYTRTTERQYIAGIH